MEFDLQTGFCSLLFAVASAVTIYLIVAFSMKGSSYDDIKASQRQDKSLHHSVGENQGDAKKLKKMKKKLNRLAAANDDSAKNLSIESNTTASNSVGTIIGTSESDSSLSPKEAETSLENAEQIEAVKPAPKNKSKPKTGKKTKDVPSPPSSSVSNNSPDKNEDSVVKDSPDSSYEKQSVLSEEGDIDVMPLNEKENISNLNVPSKLKKKSKKKKNDDNLDDKGKAIAGVNLTNNLKQLLPLLREMEMSHSELQILIDALLNKGDDSEWYQGKQDPMLKIKKQLEEMEKLHSDDVDTINGLQAKLSSLRTEINSEKISNKGLKEALAKSSTENQTLTTKYQQFSDENQTLLTRVQKLKQQLSEDQMIIAKLGEEKVHQQQLHRASDQQQEALLSLQGQVSQLAAQLQEQQTINSSIGVQLQESLGEREECRSMNAELNRLYNTSQFEVSRLTTELGALKNELEESRNQINQYCSTIEMFESTKRNLMNEVEHLKAEVNRCNQEISLHKMPEPLEEIDDNKKNGNVSFPSPDLSKYQSVIDEKELVIKNLNSELTQKEASLEKLTNDIINCKNEANKKQTVIENCNVEIVTLKNINSKLESELSEERAAVTDLNACILEKVDVVNKLTSEIDTYKHRNNELRNKNWKVVEALEKAEHSLKNASSRLQNTTKVVNNDDIAEIKSRVNKVIKRVDPSYACKDTEDNEDWISKVEGVILHIKSSNDSSTSDLKAQISKLQKMVVNYRSVVSELEIMLRNLELRIETEGKKLKSLRPCSNISPEVDD